MLSTDSDLVLIEFDDGSFGRVLLSETAEIAAPGDFAAASAWSTALEVGTKLLAHALRSTHDHWGVFAGSKVTLLPHQLWVANKVLQRWPSRWIIADDVGLGKTIEAGLILSPLVTRGRIKRLLILCPASLVAQWQKRMGDMFRMFGTVYNADTDTPDAQYWSTHHIVFASLHTMRLDRKKRWERILDAPPWDLVVVDEAHHLNTDAKRRDTLALQLLLKLDQARRLNGVLLFTGTPHRGKDDGLLGLLRLVDPVRANDAGTLQDVLPWLSEVMIRNNKARVTDMQGNLLFQPSRVHDHQYCYQPEEQAFYDKLSAYIATGKAFAQRMQLLEQRTAMLVLITLQKLAASSFAAVCRALDRRLQRLRSGGDLVTRHGKEVERKWSELVEIVESSDLERQDRRRQLEEELVEAMDAFGVSLNPREIPTLQELVSAGRAVRRESRAVLLLDVIRSLPEGTSVLIFTEYKATQALILNELSTMYGAEFTDFINGDNLLPAVIQTDGTLGVRRSERQAAAAAFQAGRIRFLVSTEAAGEGIDLQQHCHTLVHFDMPWNPMRMHQRVGRVNRFGQHHPVDVHILRNPAIIDDQIWTKLDEKLARIDTTFRGVQADAEDIRALVLGMAAEVDWDGLFLQARTVPPEKFDSWFDAQTAQLGGKDVVAAVHALIGRTAAFDYGVDSSEIPRVDLPDLAPFLRAALRILQRRLMPDGAGYAFDTPAKWREASWNIRERYEDLHFDRHRPAGQGILCTADLHVVRAAIDDLADREAFVAQTSLITAPLAAFVISDSIDAPEVTAPRHVIGATFETDPPQLVPDWKLIKLLSDLVSQPDRHALLDGTPRLARQSELEEILRSARTCVDGALQGLDLPYRRPQVRLVGILIGGA